MAMTSKGDGMEPLPESDDCPNCQSLRAQLEAAKKLMRSIAENDKTPDYGYTGKTCLNRVGAHPGMGTRWATPRDMARDFLLHNDKKEVAS